MRIEEERPPQRRLGHRAVIVAAIVVVVLGLGFAFVTEPWASGTSCDAFAQVSIDYGGAGTGSTNGTGWEEAILTALRASNYFEQFPGVDEDEALSAMPDSPPPGVGNEVTLDLDGEPRVSVERYGNGWLAGGVRFCT